MSTMQASPCCVMHMAHAALSSRNPLLTSQRSSCVHFHRPTLLHWPITLKLGRTDLNSASLLAVRQKRRVQCDCLWHKSHLGCWDFVQAVAPRADLPHSTKLDNNSSGPPQPEGQQPWLTLTTVAALSAFLLSFTPFAYSFPLPIPLNVSTPDPVVAQLGSSAAPALDQTSMCAGIAENVYADSSEPELRDEVTNESVVLEAWTVVKDNFLDARANKWTAEAWERTREEVLRRPIRSRMAAYAAIEGMLGSLEDPYTRFLTPDKFAALSKYDVTGVGLNLGEGQGGRQHVLGLLLGGPAYAAGIRQGDEIVSVNGAPVTGMLAFDAASLVRGPSGSSVSIQYRRGPCGTVRSATLTRAGQELLSPVAYRLETSARDHWYLGNALGQGPVGYVRLREFNALAKRDLVTAIERLKAAGATAFTLDLQDNPGGLVQAGVEIAKLFLEDNAAVVSTVSRTTDASHSVLRAPGPAITRAPMAVLVNERTASASEILAAALHDNCRAVLIGGRTFGKGLIQSVYELSDGSGVVLTVGRYLTPAAKDIDRNGIVPDFRKSPGRDEVERRLQSCRAPA